jgi:transcriptional regulator with XRE-family HTH domain
MSNNVCFEHANTTYRMRNAQSIDKKRLSMGALFPMEEDRPAVAQRIKTLREARGLSIRAFARLMGVSPGTAHKWESGDTANMANATLLRIAYALHTDPYYLVFGVHGKIPTEDLPASGSMPPASEPDTSASGRFKMPRRRG